jgi:hypothetical protein
MRFAAARATKSASRGWMVGSPPDSDTRSAPAAAAASMAARIAASSSPGLVRSTKQNTHA